MKKKKRTGYESKYIQKTSVEQGFYERNYGLYLQDTIDNAKAKESLEQNQKQADMSRIKCRSRCELFRHYDKKSYLCPLNGLNIYNRRKM